MWKSSLFSAGPWWTGIFSVFRHTYTKKYYTRFFSVDTEIIDTGIGARFHHENIDLCAVSAGDIWNRNREEMKGACFYFGSRTSFSLSFLAWVCLRAKCQHLKLNRSVGKCLWCLCAVGTLQIQVLHASPPLPPPPPSGLVFSVTEPYD